MPEQKNIKYMRENLWHKEKKENLKHKKVSVEVLEKM